MEILNKTINISKGEMEKSLEHLQKTFSQIRAGKASPAMLDGVRVEYYNTMTSLDQVANMIVLDVMTISIQPWERPMLSVIERAIINANLGLTPTNNGEVLLIRLPPLTEEGRKGLVKRVKAEAEQTKVSIRNIRKEANHVLKRAEGLAVDLLKSSEDRIQKITDEYIKRVDTLYVAKEKEIMTV
ncbi:MAG: ribosome recycling factor [Flavobacteriales bacterium AspAUS03]